MSGAVTNFMRWNGKANWTRFWQLDLLTPPAFASLLLALRLPPGRLQAMLRPPPPLARYAREGEADLSHLPNFAQFPGWTKRLPAPMIAANQPPQREGNTMKKVLLAS